MFGIPYSCPPTDNRKFHLMRWHINRDGYDKNGRYFGNPDNVYRYWDDDGEVHDYVRAWSRPQAKAAIQSNGHHNCKFFA